MLNATSLVLAAAEPLLAFFCVLFVAVPIGLAIGAVILRAAISLFNKFAGFGEDHLSRVPEPEMLKAMGIVFITGLVNWVVGFIIGLFGAVALKEVGQPWAELLPALFSLPFSFLVASALLAGLLPTTFVRGMGVAACQYLISILIAVVIGVIFVVIAALVAGAA
ncbi:hypothetical protein FYZ48_22170 [Gimesia chilikensis]|uniref:hypothetical protein n=1 Tax=Gimesia chilikensis TaxID=2605989 RepID=UPI0011EE99FC|nr:hypothetical protein [Gimesia chilikensis]KAA0134289.1 hypothetical protein FYZ48_22170 [Gimesia chilikensis]